MILGPPCHDVLEPTEDRRGQNTLQHHCYTEGLQHCPVERWIHPGACHSRAGWIGPLSSSHYS